jgi:hypothetical protein
VTDLTREEAEEILEVVKSARRGGTSELHFRFSLAQSPALTSAMRKLGALAEAPEDQIAWLVSNPKKLSDPL